MKLRKFKFDQHRFGLMMEEERIRAELRQTMLKKMYEPNPRKKSYAPKVKKVTPVTTMVPFTDPDTGVTYFK